MSVNQYINSRLSKAPNYVPQSTTMQSLLVVGLAIACIPLSAVLVLMEYLYISLSDRNKLRRWPHEQAELGSKTVLLSGINTPQGLRLARAFHENGHRVVGADYEPGAIPTHARFSRALHKFYRLPVESGEKQALAYIRILANIIKEEHVDLWINCISGADPSVEGQARTVIEKATHCRCFALRMNDLPHFSSQEAFLTLARSMGLSVPELHQVKSRDEVHSVLNKTRGTRRYMLYSPGKAGVEVTSVRTMLPRRTLSQTYQTLSLVPMKKTSTESWRLEQITDGMPRYSTFAVIVRGSVAAFSASHKTDTGYIEAVNPGSALFRSLLRIVQTFADKQGDDFTTHMGIDFCVDELVTDTGTVQNILLVQASPDSLAGALLFQGAEASAQICRAYLSCLSVAIENSNGHVQPALSALQQPSHPEAATPGTLSSCVYCFGQVLLKLGYEPLFKLITLQIGVVDLLRSWLSLLQHLFLCQDEIFSFQDPLPFWWSYQVYIPLRLLVARKAEIGKGNGIIETDKSNGTKQDAVDEHLLNGKEVAGT
ncbi:hypothetical protein LTR99_004034 [Exophiala xenobiotica]|uniref:ATP-grasp domain-containing protein n=1 Tax=Vermiconidia calcicola TaxID=1690605 RepID=A0AAV9QMH3_9PEZI|nr:hypothetical protein LTR92_008116 [Exophiala xenobiotica]KAK5545204.1 hypothetical protein LTR25_000211 [Vermiconidia calcicola]KAK5549149.1 hypothetical protein LTR23_000979 [Chaetothyriales sp. CCFEE 6169]KAK5220083.1 hypothetical protein LTR72_007614 [Exophiala xenobiotica]KAK5268556.1 hypothetical protein LTR96_006263 [Exophiala xenobiotica]